MRNNELKLGAVLSYLTMGLSYVISIAFTPIMLRLLGQSEYGLYNLVASVVSYLGVLNFGFGSAYMRYYSKYKNSDKSEKLASLNGMFLIVFSILGLIAIIAGTYLSFNVNFVFGSKLSTEELVRAQSLMLILVINLAISFPNIVFSTYITAHEKFIFQKTVQLIKAIISPLVILPILILGYGSIGMVIATTIINFIIEMFNMRYALKKLNMCFSFSAFDFRLLKEISIFSFYVFINLVIDQVNWNLDRFIIGRFRGTVSVAIYGLAAQLNTYYMQASTAISNVFIPRVHRLVSDLCDDEVLTELFTKIGRIQFILLSLISSGLVFFGKPFIEMWAGQNYIDSYVIVLLLVIPVTIPLIQNIGIEIQRARNLHKFRSFVYMVIAVLNLLISIPLTHKYGAIGAAIGTSISLIIGNGIIMNWYNHAIVGLDMIYFWKNILSFSSSFILPLIVGISLNLLLNLYHTTTFLLSGFLYVIVFSLSMWKFGMNDYEKNLFKKPFRFLIKGKKFL